MDGISEHYRMREEWLRLADGNGRVELLRTQELLRAELPPAPARILDVGGADGIHAAWLRDDGHDVTVADLLPMHVERARARGIPAKVGDARALDEPDGSYDAVLLLGPLYHLHERDDRVRALREAAGVLRAGGMVAAAGMTRISLAVDSIRKGFAGDPGWSEIVREVLHDGRCRGGSHMDVFWFHTAAGLESEVRGAGFRQVAVRGIEGPAWAVIDRHLPADDPRIDQVVELARLADGDRALADASAHLLAVARP